MARSVLCKLHKFNQKLFSIRTLGVQTFARRNFREFREFRLHSRKFILAKTQKSLIRKSLSSRKKQNY